MSEALVEGKKIPRRQRQGQKTEPPIRHARLQDDCRQPDMFAPKLRPAAREIFPKAAIDVIGRPASLGRWKLRDHFDGNLRIEGLEMLDCRWDQVVRARRKEHLDGRFQINACRTGFNAPLWWSLQNASAWTQNP